MVFVVFLKELSRQLYLDDAYDYYYFVRYYMSYPEFREEVLETLKRKLTEDIIAEPVQVEKINSCIRHGISFRKEGEMFSPTIYLEPFYKSFQRGQSVEFLAEELLRCYTEETGQIPDCICKLDSYETAQPDIYVKLIHVDQNKNLLKNTPHKMFIDFAIVPYFEVNDEQIFKGSVLLNDHHLQSWRVSSETVLDYAIENTRQKKGVSFKAMSEVLEEFVFKEDEELYNRARDGMFVLTNKEKYFGAAVAYYADILCDIGTRLKEDFYMLPASIHEWVVVPASQVTDERILLSMVKDINDHEVMAEEVLSYNVYYYSINSQSLRVCESA